MKKQVSFFAKPINPKVRFLEAVKVTKKNFKYAQYLDYIIPALMCFDISMDLDIKRYYFTKTKEGVETDSMFPKIRRYFYSVYQNEDMLVESLNKKINHQLFRISTDPQQMIDDVCVLLMNNLFSKTNSEV